MTDKQLTCPCCRKSPAITIKGVWPFCSQRCKDLDLGKWARGDYRIPVEVPDDDSEADLSRELPTEDSES